MDRFKTLCLGDLPEVRLFYRDVISYEHERGDLAGWIEDVYPSEQLLRDVLSRGEFYALRREGRIVAAMAVNDRPCDGYDQVDWPLKCRSGEYLVPHMLAVHPTCRGRGLARACVKETIHIAQERQMRAVRLDVLAGNDPASQLYLSEGFYFVVRMPLYYEDTGWTDYLLYEYDLTNGSCEA